MVLNTVVYFVYISHCVLSVVLWAVFMHMMNRSRAIMVMLNMSTMIAVASVFFLSHVLNLLLSLHEFPDGFFLPLLLPHRRELLDGLPKSRALHPNLLPHEFSSHHRGVHVLSSNCRPHDVLW